MNNIRYINKSNTTITVIIDTRPVRVRPGEKVWGPESFRGVAGLEEVSVQPTVSIPLAPTVLPSGNAIRVYDEGAFVGWAYGGLDFHGSGVQVVAPSGAGNNHIVSVISSTGGETPVDLSEYTTLSTTASISGDIQTRIDNLESSIDLSQYTTLSTTASISGDLQTRILSLETTVADPMKNASGRRYVQTGSFSAPASAADGDIVYVV